MSLLPAPHTPLNQHSLAALELWLKELGAQQNKKDPCLWNWAMPKWSAEIRMERDELQITWMQEDKSSQCSFPYGLPRRDVQIAINEGP